MKKFTSLLLFGLAIIAASNGQNLSIGIKPSLILLNSRLDANLHGLLHLKVQPKFSYGFGITLSEQINRFGIAVEPRLIVKGYNLEITFDEVDTYRNNYFSLPILFSFEPVDKFKIKLGPELSFLINSKVKYSGNNSFEPNSHHLKSFELSLLTGISYTILDRFDLGLRYGFGLTPFDKGQFIVYSDPISLPPIDYKYFHNYFELYLDAKIFKLK